MFTIAIVGRANVGKTTIFNRLTGKKMAIVADYHGVTRDRNEVEVDYFGMKIKFVDAAGIEYQNDKTAIAKQMLRQALISVDNADICLFIVDIRNGIIDRDIDVLNILRKKNKRTIVLLNKAENPQNINTDELYKINCETKILLSAEHNLGFNDVYNAIKTEYEKSENDVRSVGVDVDSGGGSDDRGRFIQDGDTVKNNIIENDTNTTVDKHTIKIAILGRPNAGKSTFLNNLLNEDRLITSDIAGTTRDKIELNFSYKNNNFILIDTSGIRKNYKNGDDLEFASVEKSLEALQFADIAIVLMDVTVALEEQDLSLCQKVVNSGRILIICFNKWDLVAKDKEEKLLDKLKGVICKSIAQIKGIVFFTCSAKNDDNLTQVLDASSKLYRLWNSKISAGKMNKAIENAKLNINVISELKIRYINQIKTRPPAFVAFSGKNEIDITIAKVENLKNWLYREFNLFGIPLRLSIRGKRKNGS